MAKAIIKRNMTALYNFIIKQKVNKLTKLSMLENKTWKAR